MKVTVLSFSFKHGLSEGKLAIGNIGTGNISTLATFDMFDCRAMPNPFWNESLRGCTGCNKPVCDFFVRAPPRSGYFAERIAKRLKGIEGVEIEVEHAVEPYWKTTTMRSATRYLPKTCAATANWQKYNKAINF